MKEKRLFDLPEYSAEYKENYRLTDREKFNCVSNQLIKDSFKQKLIDKLKEDKINFDAEEANYIDDQFDSVFEAVYEVHQETKFVVVNINSTGGIV